MGGGFGRSRDGHGAGRARRWRPTQLSPDFAILPRGRQRRYHAPRPTALCRRFPTRSEISNDVPTDKTSRVCAGSERAGVGVRPRRRPGAAGGHSLGAFARSRAALGSPIQVTYKFQVAANAPAFDQDYRVFVHFLDADEERMSTSDRDPSVPTSHGSRAGIGYTRTIFIPVVPYIGDAQVQRGSVSTRDQRRLTLAGGTPGSVQKVATLALLPHSENVFLLFKDGWHPAEVAPDNTTVEWQWSKRVATLSFRNPKKDVVFYLHTDNSASYAEPQRVAVKVNGAEVDNIAVTPRQDFLHKTRITTAQLGTTDMVDVTLEVDKTSVPALVPGANNRNPRELGIRVFHAFVEPVS